VPAQVIAVREAAGHDQHVIIEQAALARDQLVDMDDFGLRARQFAGQRGVVVAVAAVGVQNEDARRGVDVGRAIDSKRLL
jgi:hypothetical protein